MPRPKSFRRMIIPPKIKGFTPYGDKIDENEPIILLLEEYESIRLCDFELKNQSAVAEIMRVSRPTVTRIYESARRKIAMALTEGRTIIIEGGKVVIDNEWNRCLECGCLFDNPADIKEYGNCPLCGSRNIQNITEREHSSMAQNNNKYNVTEDCPKRRRSKKKP